MASTDLNEVMKLAYYRHNKAADSQLIDARSVSRFLEEEDEPTEGVKRGSLPGAINVPYQELLEDCVLKNPRELSQIFHKHKIDTMLTSMCYSGCGISACILELALASLGNEKTSVFLGSWA